MNGLLEIAVLAVGDADADGHAIDRALFVVEAEVPDAVSDPLGDFGSAGAGGVGQQDDEFLAAVSADDVCVAQHLCNRGGDRLEALVAGLVAVAVVVGLEVVDVDHGDAVGELLPDGAAVLLFGLGIPCSSIEDSRESVNARELCQAAVGLLQLGGGGEQLLVSIFELELGLLEAELYADSGEQFLWLDGLGQVIHAAGTEGFDDVFFFRGAGDEDHGGGATPVGLSNALTRFDAGEAGHVEVEQDDVRAPGLGDLKGLCAACGNDGFAAGVVEDFGEDHRIGDDVVNDQDARRRTVDPGQLSRRRGLLVESVGGVLRAGFH